MSLLRLPLEPLENSYSVDPLEATKSTDLRGGLQRARADMLGSAYSVNVRWELSIQNFDRLMAFYRTVGNTPFEMNLITESAEATPHNARFIPGSLRVVGRKATTTEVEAKVLAAPLAPLTGADDIALINLFEIYQDAMAEVLALLAKLVNEDLP